MNDILMEIMKCVVTVSTILVVRYLIPYLSTKIKESKYADLLDYVEYAVRWAKQTLKDNEDKKEQVIAKVIAYVQQKGLNVSFEEVDMLIEAIYETIKKEG